MYQSRKTIRIALPALLSLGVLVGSTGVQAQECEVTPEGRICHIPQEIRAGIEVDPDTQRLLGLITINGGCSGTLLNRFWVLTARHCVTQPPPPGGARTVDVPQSNPLIPASQIKVTAAWAPGLVGLAELFMISRGT
jgi:hypothetical protein